MNLFQKETSKSVFLDPEQHCVGWTASKRLLMIGSEEKTGTHSAFTSRLLVFGDPQHPSVQAQAEIRIPTHRFESDSEIMDREIPKLLGAPQHTEIIVRTLRMSKADLEKIWLQKKNTEGKLPCEITVCGKTFPIKIPYRIFEPHLGKAKIFQGTFRIRFSSLGIHPPSLVGGIVAQIQDEFELHYQLREDRFPISISS